MGLTLQFVPYSQIERLSSLGRIKKLLNLAKEDKIVLLEGRLRKEEETELIKTTMEQINDEFSGIELAVIYPGGVKKLEDQHGNCLPDCFWLKEGSTALDFAYKLHTDFGKNFIRAIDVKTKKTVGKDHVLKHRDVVEIIHGK